MLVLTRKIGETIRIGRNVSVRVLEIKGPRVRLGIEAPGSTRILRQELSFDAAPEGGPAEEAAVRPDHIV